MRYYNAWTCRFINIDPLAAKYPFYTPYQYAGNKPINFIDLDGAEPAQTGEGMAPSPGQEANGASPPENQDQKFIGPVQPGEQSGNDNLAGGNDNPSNYDPESTTFEMHDLSCNDDDCITDAPLNKYDNSKAQKPPKDESEPIVTKKQVTGIKPLDTKKNQNLEGPFNPDYKDPKQKQEENNEKDPHGFLGENKPTLPNPKFEEVPNEIKVLFYDGSIKKKPMDYLQKMTLQSDITKILGYLQNNPGAIIIISPSTDAPGPDEKTRTGEFKGRPISDLLKARLEVGLKMLRDQAKAYGIAENRIVPGSAQFNTSKSFIVKPSFKFK